jgi:hypothetical protein
MSSTFTPEQWAARLESDTMVEAEMELRKNTYTGRPAGSREFVQWAESCLGRTLSAQPGGRPRKSAASGAGALAGQVGLFDAQ